MIVTIQINELELELELELSPACHKANEAWSRPMTHCARSMMHFQPLESGEA